MNGIDVDGGVLHLADAQELYDTYAGIPHTLIFDPPWEMAHQFTMGRSDNVLAFCDGYRAGDIVRIFGPPSWVFVWDCVSSWYTPNRPLRRMKMCLWFGDVEKYNQKGFLFGSPCGRPRIVTNSRGSYLFRPDTGKMLSDVYSEPITSLHSRSSHKHSKPLDWVTALIGNTTRNGDVIIDPFAGSGVTLAACRKLGVRWIGGDIDQSCIDSIIAMNRDARDPRQREMFSQ